MTDLGLLHYILGLEVKQGEDGVVITLILRTPRHQQRNVNPAVVYRPPLR